jgi:sialidase-1
MREIGHILREVLDINLSHRIRVRAPLLATMLAIVVGGAPRGAEPNQEGVLVLSSELGDKALAVLRDGLNSDEFWPSMHAAEGLTQAGYGAEVRADLADRVRTEEDPLRRCGLARELVRAGDRAALDVLFEILALPDLDARVHAAESLYKVAEVGDGRLLRVALEEDDKPALQAMAAAALARRGSREGLALIRQRLAGDEPSGRTLAAYVLARLGNKRDVPRLLEIAKMESDALNASFAVNAAAALGDPGARATVGHNLAVSDPAIRAYAAEAAGLTRAVELADALAGLLMDETLDVRVRAAQALLTLAQPAGESDAAAD